MAYYELIHSLETSVSTVCFKQGSWILAVDNSIVYYRGSPKYLHWFGQKELKPEAMTMNDHFWSVITVDGSLMIFPLYALAEDHYQLAWRKFITKGYFTIISNNNEEGFLESLGSCLVARDRNFENHLEVSVLKIKGQGFTGIMWAEHLLIICLTQEFWVINTNTGLLERKIVSLFNISKVKNSEDFIVIYSESCYYILTIEELLNDKLMNAKKNYWEGEVILMCKEPKVGITYKERFEVLDLKTASFPVSSFFLPEVFAQSFIWGNVIIAVKPGVGVIGKVLCEFKKMVNKGLHTRKICVCGNCLRRSGEVNYEEWIHFNKSDSLLWKSTEEIGKVLAYWPYENYLEIVTEKGIFTLKQLSVDISGSLISAIELSEIAKVHQLVLLAESRSKDLAEYLSSLITPSTYALTVFKLKILSKPDPLLTSKLCWSYFDLHTEIYNYLWACYFSLPAHCIVDFSILISRLLGSILNFELHKQPTCTSLQPYQHINSKPLFGRLEIELGLCHILPLLIPIPISTPINKAMSHIVANNFNKLKASTQLYLLVLSEQISIELPVHKLIITCEKIEGCKMLRIICKLASIDILFSQYDPVFTQDHIISLLPLPFCADFSVRTTRIFKKALQEVKNEISRFEATINLFLRSFAIIFNTTEGFSKHFLNSLTRFLILFAYALHKLKSIEVYSLFVKLLRGLNGFYDLSQVSLAATALRSCIVFSGIYEFQQDWVSVFKARLLLNDSEPLALLFELLEKVKEEHEKAEMIYSCLLYSLKAGISKVAFLEWFAQSQYESLAKYIVNHF